MLASNRYKYHTGYAGQQPVQIPAAYLSRSRPPVGTDLNDCFGGGMLVLLAGVLSAKHVDWNSRLSTTREKPLRDYTDVYSCLIFGTDTPTTNPYNTPATPDALDIVITRNLPSLVHLTSCSEHLPVRIDTMRRSSFQYSPDRPD
jgi:hypothetical protein